MSILSLLTEFHSFSIKELFYIRSKAKSYTLKEGAKLVTQGGPGNVIFYIESGVVRQFEQSDDAEEETYWILGENQWVCNIESYVTNIPATCTIEALSKVKCKSITKDQLNELINEMPILKDLAIRIHEQYLLNLDMRNRIHRTKNADERYHRWEVAYPCLSNRVKLKHIAQFLNITPQQLSRIRKQRAENPSDQSKS